MIKIDTLRYSIKGSPVRDNSSSRILNSRSEAEIPTVASGRNSTILNSPSVSTPPPPRNPHRIRSRSGVPIISGRGSERRFPLWLLVLSLIFLFIILPACSKAKAEKPPIPLPAESSSTAPQYPVKDLNKQSVYKVIRVVDGDTVVISIDNKNVKVRLIGIDTPETVDPRKPVQAYGKEASNFLANLLKGEEVSIEYDGEKPELDKYDRLLAYLYRVPDGLFVNLEIVRQGYGHAYTKYPFKYMDLFRDAERQARESAKGLWAPDVQKSGIPESKPSEVKDDSGNNKQEEPVEVTVYVTRTGAKYHRAGCKYLSKSMIPISLKEARTKYGPCGVCNPPE